MSGYVSAELRSSVREHFVGQCAYCQTAESLTVVTFEIEHIEPRSSGGLTEFENLCLACPACNRFKSNRTIGRDESGRESRLFHPHRDLWLEHFDWSVNGTVIVGLTNIGIATVNALRMNRQQVVAVRALWVEAGRHPPK